jgi:hypothetical protein
VIVDEDERAPRRELINELENLSVPLGGDEGSHIDFLYERRGLGVGHDAIVPLVAVAVAEGRNRDRHPASSLSRR